MSRLCLFSLRNPIKYQVEISSTMNRTPTGEYFRTSSTTENQVWRVRRSVSITYHTRYACEPVSKRLAGSRPWQGVIYNVLNKQRPVLPPPPEIFICAATAGSFPRTNSEFPPHREPKNPVRVTVCLCVCIMFTCSLGTARARPAISPTASPSPRRWWFLVLCVYC